MAIRLSAESTLDFTPELLEKYGVSIVHFQVEKGGVSHSDQEVTPQECWDYTFETKKMCHTAAVNVDVLKDHFAELTKSGDQVIHFCISSGISSGYNNAVAAADGNPNIYVVDSHVTSGGIGLLVIYAYNLIQAGYTLEEIKPLLLKARDNVEMGFILDRLEFLYKGGRCSRLSLFGANLLKIHPTIVCDEEGKFGIGKKYRGNINRCIIQYCKDLLTDCPNIDKNYVFLNYANPIPEVDEECVKMLKDFGFKNIYVTQASVTNCYHSGPNARGIQFFYNGFNPIPDPKK